MVLLSSKYSTSNNDACDKSELDAVNAAGASNALPAPPTNVRGSAVGTYYGLDDARYTLCPDGSAAMCMTITLSWKDVATTETGYRVYFRPCSANVQTGAVRCGQQLLYATFGRNATRYRKPIKTEGGDWLVASFNAAGSSKRVLALRLIAGY